MYYYYCCCCCCCCGMRWEIREIVFRSGLQQTIEMRAMTPRSDVPDHCGSSFEYQKVIHVHSRVHYMHITYTARAHAHNMYNMYIL